MRPRASRVGSALAVAAAVVVLAACGSGGGAGVQPAKRTIYMAAIEPKGSTSVDKEPFPTAKLPPGGGYVLKEPTREGVWEVSTYRWTPNTIVINQGDEVTLEVMGVNGKEHPTTIEGYNVSFNVLRGQLSRVNFKADKAGIYNITCSVHLPSMIAQLVILPRGG